MASLCGAMRMFMMIIHIIGTKFERGSRVLAVWWAGAARRDDGAVEAADGRCEPPKAKIRVTVGGALSDRGQLRFKIASGKTVVTVNPSSLEAA